VGASGTGLQAVTCAIHALGAGVSHAIGTGGRDLSPEVAGATALQGLELLRRDPDTEVIVLISKPPAPEVASRLLGAARRSGKPVVIQFIGDPVRAQDGNVHFSGGLSATARTAVSLLAGHSEAASDAPDLDVQPRSGYLRGLFAGGTLALEAQQMLAGLEPLTSNVPILGARPVADLTSSQGHAILDLGADEFTVGRLHPMMDQELRLRRLRQEASDPEVGLLLLDVVLGEGSHPDPASELAPAIDELETEAEVVVVMVGTDEDPQGLDDQCRRLVDAGARVFVDVSEGFGHVAARLGHRATTREPRPASAEPPSEPAELPAEVPVDVATLSAPLAAINVGLDSFYDSLVEQGAEAVQLDWRPPAGGNERLMALLEKMR
jgi:FdrA protein